MHWKSNAILRPKVNGSGSIFFLDNLSDRDCMVVGLTTTFAVGAYHHWCCGFDSRSGWGVQHYVIKLSVICGRSVVFSGSSGFLHQYNWPPRYNWNIAESGVKHHQTKPICPWLPLPRFDIMWSPSLFLMWQGVIYIPLLFLPGSLIQIYKPKSRKTWIELNYGARIIICL